MLKLPKVIADAWIKYQPLVRIFKYRYQILISLFSIFMISSIIFDVIFYYYEGTGDLSIGVFIVKMLYFNVITGTTIGYGDISPSMWQTQLVMIFYGPLAIGSFAGFLGAFATIAVIKFRKKSLGTALVYEDIDLVIGGGYKDKLEAVVSKLICNDPNLKICVISDFYEEKPELYDNNGVIWIKGKITDLDALEMIKVSVNKYCVLSINPSNKNDDSFALLAYDAIKNKESDNNDLRILAEVVRNNLIGFYKNRDIDYIQLSRSAIIAKEIVTPGSYDFFKSIFNNRLPGNQYNYFTQEETTWQEQIDYSLNEKNAIPIGFIDSKNEWQFFPDNKSVILPKGSTLKILARESLDLLDSRTAKLLIVGFDEYKTNNLIDLYLADPRYQHSDIVVLSDNKVGTHTYGHVDVKFVIGKQTDERFLANDLDIETFDNILIMNSNKPECDENNFLTYRIIRELNPSARVVCEIISENLRLSLENKYEDLDNQFTEPAAPGQLIQEFQDPGALTLVEKFADDNQKEDIFDVPVVNVEKWSNIRKYLLEEFSFYAVGYKLEGMGWEFQPNNDSFNLELPAGTLIKCMK
ncbi:MAG: potassium channel family protein [Patescibacteria group bacterium]|nr:potassium channel family protein [Patescibacteria group bacterium]